MYRRDIRKGKPKGILFWREDFFVDRIGKGRLDSIGNVKIDLDSCRFGEGVVKSGVKGGLFF